mmetsp:Transcript_73519/g.163341  ORF Transcript_73519/g.163341 Transcript_73519/m.163341 type:complete len:88 (+) Transcript_73519:1-264(+)
MCSELFNDALMARLASRISGSEHVRAVATLRPFPNGLHSYHQELRPERCEMSWTAAMASPKGAGSLTQNLGAPVHIYVRSRMCRDAT